MSLSIRDRILWIVTTSMAVVLGASELPATASSNPLPSEANAQLTIPSVVVPQAVRKDGAVPCPLVSIKTPLSMGVSVPERAGGNKAQQDAFIMLMKCLIAAIPNGGSASVSTYELDDKSATDGMISAIKDRGVDLVFATSKQHRTAQTSRLKKVINADRRTKSRFILCNHSCYWSGLGGIHHAKDAAFKVVIGAGGKAIKNLIVTASGNLDRATVRQWNAWQVFTGKPKLYSAMKKYIDGMSVDRTRHFDEVTEGGITLAFGPSQKSDLSIRALKNFGCSRGTGIIKADMYIIARSRGNQAVSMLQQKQREGCMVSVIYSSVRSTKSAVKRLVNYCPVYKKQRRCIEVFDAYKPKTHVQGSMYSHIKDIAMRGYKIVNGKKVVVNIYVGGSRNWSDNSHNTEVMAMASSKVFVTKAFSHFDMIARHSRKK